MNDFLFNDFNNTTPKAWKQKIQVDLNGLDYNQNLLWHSLEDIVVKPFYTKKDSSNLNINLPQENFTICKSVYIDNETIANKLAINAIEKGANAIEFSANTIFNFDIVLQKIDTKKIKLYFKLNFLDSDFCVQLSKHLNTKNHYLNIDIIGNLAKNGNWFFNLKKDHLITTEIINNTNNSLAVNASIYQNAGANCVQQLAYTLAHANEYLNYFGKSIANTILFNFSIGSNYFFEIAKLRAFRILWNSLLDIYELPESEAHIFARPSYRNKTIYSNQTNSLRCTSECMSAIFGGANTISNITHDTIFKKSNELSEHISLHQLVFLKEDIELDKPQNYANGSYYIDYLTEQLTEKALDIFKQIEKGGGFLKQLKAGTIQKKISESSDIEKELFDSGKIILIGTNKNQNQTIKMKQNLELFPFMKKRFQKTIIQPITTKRLAEELEQKRLKNE